MPPAHCRDDRLELSAAPACVRFGSGDYFNSETTMQDIPTGYVPKMNRHGDQVAEHLFYCEKCGKLHGIAYEGCDGLRAKSTDQPAPTPNQPWTLLSLSKSICIQL